MARLSHPIEIIGIELRTTNDKGRAFKEIPPFWQKFYQEDCQHKIQNKLNDDIYAVYTHFENIGKNNQGMYSLIIGCPVKPNTHIPDGFTTARIPAGIYRVFPVEKGRRDKIGEAWQAIWSIPSSEKIQWSFTCEFERYHSSGEIDIFIGLKE